MINLEKIAKEAYIDELQKIAVKNSFSKVKENLIPKGVSPMMERMKKVKKIAILKKIISKIKK